MKPTTRLLAILSRDRLKDVPTLAAELQMAPRDVLAMLVELRQSKAVGFYDRTEKGGDFGWRLRN